MRTRITSAIFVMAAMTLSSCVKEKLEVTYNGQESKISTYIENELKKSNEYTVEYLSGSNRLTRKQGEGEALGKNGTVTFYYAGYTFNGNVVSTAMFASNHEATVANAGWELTEIDLQPLTVNLKENDLVEGLRNGLEGVKGGQECEIVFSGKYGFGNSTFGIIPANSALLYKIWVISVSND